MPLTKEEKEKLMSLKAEADEMIMKTGCRQRLIVKRTKGGENAAGQTRFYTRDTDQGAGSHEHYVKKEKVLLDQGLVTDYCARTARSFALKLLEPRHSGTGQTRPVLEMIQEMYSDLYGIFGNCTPKQYIPRRVMIENWIAAQPAPSYRTEELIFQTMRGEKVRSKFEKMVADTLFTCNIPYHYERPLTLGKETVLPDFTLLDPETGSCNYLEACGLLTDRDYVCRNLIKLRKYECAGLFADGKVMYVFDDPVVPFDTELFRFRLSRRFGLLNGVAVW